MFPSRDLVGKFYKLFKEQEDKEISSKYFRMSQIQLHSLLIEIEIEIKNKKSCFEKLSPKEKLMVCLK